MFLKSHRKWVSPELKKSDIEAFREGCMKAKIDPKKFVEPPLSFPLIALAQVVKPWTSSVCSLNTLRVSAEGISALSTGSTGPKLAVGLWQ